VKQPRKEVLAAVRQIVSRAVASDRVIDIFSAAGLKSPEISILSDEFLAEVKDLPQKNLAFVVVLAKAARTVWKKPTSSRMAMARS
jgi:type I restriction enzyme R subunit